MSDLSTLTRYKLTVDDYHKLAEVGILNEDSRVELIEGELIEMSPIGPPHSWMINRLTKKLVQAAGDLAVVSVQNSVRLSRHSEPQPDFVLLRPHMARERRRIAGTEDTLLVIEVADSSLSYDRGIKLSLYARSGVPEVWIVNMQDECIETHSGPAHTGYTRSDIRRKGDHLRFDAIPAIDIDLTELFS